MSKREEGEETPSESDTSSDEEDSAAGSQSGSESEADSQTGSEESGESSEASEADSDGENSEMKGGSIGTSSEPSKARSAASDPKRPNQNLSGPTVAAAKCVLEYKIGFSLYMQTSNSPNDICCLYVIHV